MMIAAASPLSMMKRVLRSLGPSLRIPSYKIEYFVKASFQYYLHLLLGGTPYSRLKHYSNKIFAPTSAPKASRLALFVAYHPGRKVPLSNVNYLKALRECGFQIFYIHNGRLPDDVIDSLGDYCDRVFCRQNIGQDFGAWKDAYLFCLAEGLLSDADWLLMCNDSNFFLAGPRGEHFVEKFRRELESNRVELIALNKNYELWQHYQSYFLCFSRSVFRSSSFDDFWRKYRPLTHRYHAINKGEIALTRRVLGGVSAKVIYESTGLAEVLSEACTKPEEFYSLLPQNAMYLCEKVAGTVPLSSFRIQQVLALLDCHNPAHAYALLFVRYLWSPFLKKDLLRQGVYSLPQIAFVLSLISLERESDLWREIIGSYERAGRHTSYIRYPKDAFRQGINAIEGAVFSGYGDFLASLGIRD